jgi:hypothetical protein
VDKRIAKITKQINQKPSQPSRAGKARAKKVVEHPKATPFKTQ